MPPSINASLRWRLSFTTRLGAVSRTVPSRQGNPAASSPSCSKASSLVDLSIVIGEFGLQNEGSGCEVVFHDAKSLRDGFERLGIDVLRHELTELSPVAVQIYQMRPRLCRQP